MNENMSDIKQIDGAGGADGAITGVRSEKGRVALNALSMAAGTMTSRVLGLMREMAFAAIFSRTVTDAWTAAFRLPNLFRRLLGEGSLSVSFIPVFIESKVKDPSGKRSHELVNGFYSILLLILILLTTLGILYSEPILKLLLDENYMLIPGKFELTVRLARIMFGFIFLMSTYAYFMGILNALGHFALAAMAPTLFNLAMIISTLIPQNWFPIKGDGLAWGVMVGGFLQMIILVPALKRKGFLPKINFHWGNPDISKVFRNMVPGLLGTGLLQITTLVNLKFASQIGEGTISYIYWADRLLELPLSLVSVSLSTALLPTLSEMWSRGEKEHMSDTANFYLRLNLFVAVPAAIGLYFLSVPIVELLFKRGHFNQNDVLITASVVQVYAFILIASSMVRVLVPAYYAVKNTWLPAVASGVALVAHVMMAPILMKHWGIVGLVSSSGISATINFLILILMMPILVAPFHYFVLLKSFIKFLLAGVGIFLGSQIYFLVIDYVPQNFIVKAIVLAVSVGVAGILFSLFSYILKIEEFTKVSGQFLKKIKTRLGKK